ncbi:MAG: hypothetical protein U0894_07715 [Pirellulales bacterium]
MNLKRQFLEQKNADLWVMYGDFHSLRGEPALVVFTEVLNKRYH